MIARLALSLFTFALCACSSSFDRAWRGADLSPSGVARSRDKAVDTRFEGRWSGQWRSDQHHAPFSSKPAGGKMQLVLAESAPGKYRANVRAHWLAFRSDYEVMLDGEERGRMLRLRGVQNVRPIFGGPYRYDALVSPARFTLRYDSRYDRGRVELTR